MSWTAEAFPGIRALAGGSFDDPDSLRIDRHGWTRSKQKWFVCPPGVEVFEKSAFQPAPKARGIPPESS